MIPRTELIEVMARAIADCKCDIVKDGYSPIAEAALNAMLAALPDIDNEINKAMAAAKIGFALLAMKQGDGE